MLEKTPDYANDADRIGEPGHTRTQRADAENNQLNGYAGLRRFVKRPDQFGVGQAIELQYYSRFFSSLLVGDLAFDEVGQPLPHVDGRDQEPAVLRLPR